MPGVIRFRICVSDDLTKCGMDYKKLPYFLLQAAEVRLPPKLRPLPAAAMVTSYQQLMASSREELSQCSHPQKLVSLRSHWCCNLPKVAKVAFRNPNPAARVWMSNVSNLILRCNVLVFV